jgi:hypothetical protein
MQSFQNENMSKRSWSFSTPQAIFTILLWDFSLCFLSGFFTSEGAWASTVLVLLGRVTNNNNNNNQSRAI